MRKKDNNNMCDISDDHSENLKDKQTMNSQDFTKDANDVNIRRLFMNKKKLCANEKTSNEKFELYNPFSFDI